jgi:hypothetical protein
LYTRGIGSEHSPLHHPARPVRLIFATALFHIPGIQDFYLENTIVFLTERCYPQSNTILDGRHRSYQAVTDMYVFRGLDSRQL